MNQSTLFGFCCNLGSQAIQLTQSQLLIQTRSPVPTCSRSIAPESAAGFTAMSAVSTAEPGR